MKNIVILKVGGGGGDGNKHLIKTHKKNICGKRALKIIVKTYTCVYVGGTLM